MSTKKPILDKWKLYDLIGYETKNPRVRAFHNSTAKTKVSCCPARSSKSYSAAHDVLPDILIPGTVHWIVGPSYGLAEKEFRYIHQRLVLERDRLGLPKPKTCNTNHRAGSLYIKWGPPWNTIVEGKSADNPDSLLGEQVDSVIYSEAAQLPRRIREQYVYPRLMTTKGREIIPTTPAAGAEWVHELFMQGEVENDLGIDSFTWDVSANPAFPMDEFELARKRYGADSPYFREQYLGEWVFYAGLVYPNFDESLHVIEPFEIPDSWPRIRGIDFGHRDPFVTLWCAVGPEGELYFYREYYNREGTSIKQHATMIKEYTKDERMKMTVADPSGKQMIEELGMEGIGCIPANNDKLSGRQRVLDYMLPTPDGVVPFPYQNLPISQSRERWPRMYFFNTMKETIREFKYYRWKERPNKAWSEGEKEKTEGEDHSMDVVRYMTMTRPSPFKSQKFAPRGSFQAMMNKIKLSKPLGQYIGV